MTEEKPGFIVEILLSKQLIGRLVVWAKDKEEAEELAGEEISFKIKKK